MKPSLKPYPATKDSGVSWLGNVPQQWEVHPALAAFRPKAMKNTGMIETTVLSLSYGRIVVKPAEKLHGLVPESFETYQIVDPGDLIVRTTDMQNDKTSLRVGHSRDRGIITSAYMCLRTTDRLTSEFGYQVLNAYDLQKTIYGFGSGLRQNLDFDDIKRMPVLVPPLSEQAAIVRFLNHADRLIGRCIRTKQKLIRVLDEHKQGIIHRVVTRGLDPDVKLKSSGLDWLPEVPEHWDVLPLKRILRRLIDTEHKTAPAVDASDYRVIRTTAVRHGRLRISGTYCTTPDGFRDWTRRGLPEEGDVVFTREAPAGEACVVPGGLHLCLGQRTVLMKLDRRRYHPQFLVVMIYGGPPAHRIKIASQGSTVGHFNMDDIASLTVLAPPLDEQEAIIDYIDSATQSLDVVSDQAENEIALLQEYRTRLVIDVVTGKLDVRDVAATLDDQIGEVRALEGETDVHDRIEASAERAGEAEFEEVGA
jgi:type I restriction enzyme S subunit